MAGKKSKSGISVRGNAGIDTTVSPIEGKPCAAFCCGHRWWKWAFKCLRPAMVNLLAFSVIQTYTVARVPWVCHHPPGSPGVFLYNFLLNPTRYFFFLSTRYQIQSSLSELHLKHSLHFFILTQGFIRSPSCPTRAQLGTLQPLLFRVLGLHRCQHAQPKQSLSFPFIVE